MTEIESFPDYQSVVDYTNEIESEEDDHIGRVQWLADGQTPTEVEEIMAHREMLRRNGRLSHIKNAEQLANIKLQRIAAIKSKL